MALQLIDWIIIAAFFTLSLIIGLSVMKRAGKNSGEFFLSGRNMPWWLLGISMVATTFSADTPNLVTDIVRKNGVSGNWVWWAFLLTGMLTVFVYARLWRRSGVMTDLEFYELRYSGQMAAFLRGFRATYLGVVFNVVIMASVTLAAIKIGGVMLGLSPLQVVIIASVVTVIYSALGGLSGVIITDFFQFILAMTGSIWACIILLNRPEVGGLSGLFSHEAVLPKTPIFPELTDPSAWIPLLLVPLLIQWWSVWYPGAEPGGGGYIAQRMFAAKNEKHAVGATLLFNMAHYGLRPWPWILIALASLILFPDHASIKAAFPHIDDRIVNDDLAYPAMLSYLPAGVLGLVVASLIAAFMSTISTHLNWGASYISHDVFKRFLTPHASEKELVSIGRWSTVVLMILAAMLSLFLSNALQAFNILLQIGAGTGLLFILRWFWWRINAWSELSAMVISFAVALFLEVIWVYAGWPELKAYERLVIGVVITTAGWLLVTLLTKPEDDKTLLTFYKHIRPHAFGWRKVLDRQGMSPLSSGSFSAEIIAMLFACVAVYMILFSIGYWIYGKFALATLCTALAVICIQVVFRLFRKIDFTG
jgi:solute:Na+ symporter, SSS family